LRLGTPALTTRGFKEPQMAEVATLIDRVLAANGDVAVTSKVREDVRVLCAEFHLPG
jgi:glycine hydroxymethyltransferase